VKAASGRDCVAVAIAAVLHVVRITIRGPSRGEETARSFSVTDGQLVLDGAVSPDDLARQCLESWFEQLNP
jgi:hypothetical protein